MCSDINPEPLQFLASNFKKSTVYCNHPTIAPIRISSVDWTNYKAGLYLGFFVCGGKLHKPSQGSPVYRQGFYPNTMLEKKLVFLAGETLKPAINILYGRMAVFAG